MSTGLVFVFVFGILIGVGAILAAEAAVVLLLLKRFNQKRERAESLADSVGSIRDLDPQQSLDFASKKQGTVWILELDNTLKNWMVEKIPKEQRRRRESLEVSPSRRYGRIKDHRLILKDSAGVQTTVQLKGCSVEAVSASSLPSRKWAKRFPIKLESKTSVVYKDNQVLYIYLDTSWEKESWCKALRLASCDNKDRLSWFNKLKEKFQIYLTDLNAGYSFMRPSTVFHSETIDKGNIADVTSSKVWQMLKKISRKSARFYSESKGGYAISSREERKLVEKGRQPAESVYGRVNTAKRIFDKSSEENSLSAALSLSSQSSSQGHSSDVESEDKTSADEGTLSWNLLMSRFFFDAKLNAGVLDNIQARIQRMLANMRTPAYIGEVFCTKVESGSLPPYVHGIRVLPMDMSEVWAFEVDIEYSGGAALHVETRLEVSEIDQQKAVDDTNSPLHPGKDVPIDLVEGFADLGEELNLSMENINREDEKDNVPGQLQDGSTDSRGSTNLSKWKSILNAITKHVSQVPLSLSIRITSLRGTLRLHLKPPPSDHLWFGFTSMPDIEFDLESSVGEHKITSGKVALFLISRFKASIRETMVLPNCDSICIPWMLAEKDDWVPRQVAPFVWLNREAAGENGNGQEAFGFRPNESNVKVDSSEGSTSHHSDSCFMKQKSISLQPTAESSSLDRTGMAIQSKSLPDLAAPLLERKEAQDSCKQEKSGTDGSPCSPSVQSERSDSTNEEDDSKAKKIGRKARMLDLGKRMGEKLEEKRRHIEEKSRHIVEKMRGPGA